MMSLSHSKMTILISIPAINILLHHDSLLMILLNLEIMSITTIIMTALFMTLNTHMEFLAILIIITIATCEASIMLSTLILMNRMSSTDYVSSMMFSKC